MAREAIGGVVQTVLTKDIVILLIFISAAILVAIFLKKPLNKLLSGFAEKYEESGLGEWKNSRGFIPAIFSNIDDNLNKIQLKYQWHSLLNLESKNHSLKLNHQVWMLLFD